jgi:predicted RNA-binding protein
MNTGNTHLSIKDSIRLFDLNSNQVNDTYKKSAMDILNDNGQTKEPEKKTRKSSGDIRYKLDIKPENTAKYLKKLNAYKTRFAEEQGGKTDGPVYTEKDLMSTDDLETCYNRIWHDKNLEDLKKVAIFQISSNIQSAINDEFLIAEKNKRPVEGSDLDNLICLAMTVPFRESSRGLIAKIMDDLIMPEKTDILVRRGIRYVDRKGKEIIVKVKQEKLDPVVQAMTQGSNKPKETEENISEEEKKKTIYVNNVSQAIASRATIKEMSEAYREMTKDSGRKGKEDKESKEAEEQQDQEI